MKSHSCTRCCSCDMAVNRFILFKLYYIQLYSPYLYFIILIEQPIIYNVMSMEIKQQKRSSSPTYIINQITRHKQPSKQITQKIIHEITDGKLIIPQQQKPLRVRQIQSQSELEGSRLKIIEQLRKSKDRTMNQLAELDKKQQQLQKALRSFSQKHSKLSKSTFTQEQKQKIKQVLKLARMSQQKKKEKHEMIMNTFTNILKKQRQEEEQLVQKLRYEHKKAVEHNMISIELRKKKRQQSFKQMSQRMLEVKRKKYIHLIKQKQDEQSLQKQKLIAELKIKQLSQRFKLDFKQIKQHQNKYRKIMEQKSEERRQKMKTDQQKNMGSSRKYSQNMFSRLIEQQQKQKKKLLSNKQKLAKQMRIKVNQFKQYVRQNHKPAKKSPQSINLTPQHPQQSQKQPLSHKQRLQQGNAYLKLAKKLRKQKDDPKLITQPQIIKYVDYLKTIRKKSERAGTVQQFRSLVKTQESIDYSSASRAVKLVDQIQFKSKKTKDQRMLETIQNKIDLLKVLI